MDKDYSVSVCMSIHNQEPIAKMMIDSIIQNTSDQVKEIIFVFDGCTDNTEAIIRENAEVSKVPVKYFHAPNVWETKANNISFKAASYPYILTIQDDMVLLEKDFDKRMMIPFFVVENLLGVTARNAQDEFITPEGTLMYKNVFGKDVKSPRHILGLRDIIVRGPIMFSHEKLAALDYLNEEFAPIYADDYDLCFRAARKEWVVGAFMAEYASPEHWGKTRQHNQALHNFWFASVQKNEKMIMERHADLMNRNEFQDIVISGLTP